MRFLLVKTGTTVQNVASRRGDFEGWFARGLGLAERDLRVVEVFRGAPLPAIDDVDAVVVSGSAAMVTDGAPWSLATERWLRDLVDAQRPVLGVCYGHQLLARALGGEVFDNPNGRQIGTVDVTFTAEGRRDPLTSRLPTVVHVPVSHSQAVARLPEQAVRLGHSPLDNNHAFAYGDRAFGVQFHPEFDADIIRGYIDARESQITDEGLDPDALRSGARDTPHGHELLRSFANYARRLTE